MLIDVRLESEMWWCCLGGVGGSGSDCANVKEGRSLLEEVLLVVVGGVGGAFDVVEALEAASASSILRLIPRRSRWRRSCLAT